MGDRITFNTRWVKWNEHVADIAAVDEVDVSDFVPATAKLVHGVIGLSGGTSARKMWVASNASTTVRVGAVCDAQGTGDISYGVSGSKDFTLPMLTAQTLWWYTETTAAHYALGINGFTDDL